MFSQKRAFHCVSPLLPSSFLSLLTFVTPSGSSKVPSMAPNRNIWLSLRALFSFKKALYPSKVP